jgi:hypothetical protein
MTKFGDMAQVIATKLDEASEGVEDIYKGGYKDFSDMYSKHMILEDILLPVKNSRDPQKALDVVKNLFDSESRLSKLSAIGAIAPEVLPIAKKIQAFRVW